MVENNKIITLSFEKATDGIIIIITVVTELLDEETIIWDFDHASLSN